MNVVWEAMGIKAELSAKLKDNQIDQPTPVQAAAIPELLAGYDVTARSQTGTGKTLAFILPALQCINTEADYLQVMVLAPTQELAMQIFRVAELYGEELGVKVQQLIGGASMQRQVDKLKQRPQLVVGTPGRVHEIHMSGKLKLHQIKLLIIDEADQVFQLGSTKEVETLLRAMDKERQIAFFSATRPLPMEEVEQRWMREPKAIDVTTEQKLPEQVDHYYLVADKRDKVDTARRLIRMLEPKSALLFINDTDEIANYEAKLSYEGFTVETLYGDADKQRRAATLARFREGRCQLLLATDVAARGLDIAGLPLVVQLDPATDADHYVHRAGRTGRMGKSGTVVSIVTPQQVFIMSKFSKQLGIKLLEKQMFRGRLWEPEELNSYQSGPKRDRRPTGGGADGLRGGIPAARTGASQSESGERKQGRPEARVNAHSAKPAADRGQSGTAAASGKPQRSSAKAETKSQREKDRKNKGAPKWLKAKREQQ